jgi:Tol biopolymer transport system component
MRKQFDRLMGLELPALIALVIASFLEAGRTQGDTFLMSKSSLGSQAGDNNFQPDVSDDGRVVVFSSAASDLVQEDTIAGLDVFLRNRFTGQTVLVSKNAAGKHGNDISFDPSLSANGRFVAYASNADNLVPFDTNGACDVFVFDMQAGQVVRVSVNSSGMEGNDWSGEPQISANGRFVAFSSVAGNLVPGDSNGKEDVFVHDTLTGETRRVSVASSGTQGNEYSRDPSISADGRYVSFSSFASNLVAGDTNATFDIFVHDRQTAQTVRASVSSAGDEANGGSPTASLSADGRLVAFCSGASNLVTGDTKGWSDIFVRDMQKGVTTRVSVSSAGAQANSFSSDPSCSSDGTCVVFQSYATNLAPGAPGLAYGVFVHELASKTTTCLSMGFDGSSASGDSMEPSVSANGRWVAFESESPNLVPADGNLALDVFLVDRTPAEWVDLGFALPGLFGSPCLIGGGELLPSSAGELMLGNAIPFTLTMLLVSLSSNPLPFKGGVLVPLPPALTLPLATSALGAIQLQWKQWPADLSGASLYFQYVIQDWVAPGGLTLSNALRADVP